MGLYHIYCDESRQTHEKYMILGGIVLPEKRDLELESAILKFRSECNMHAELKWGKVSKNKLPEYQKFLDLFFDSNSRNAAHFHCVILDTTKFDHGSFNEGDKEIGFYKFYYQLLLHCFGKKFSKIPDTRLLVRLDQRNSSYPLEKLKSYLNDGMGKKFGVGAFPFRSLEPRDSKQVGVMQMVDILIGAIGYQKNDHHLRPEASPARKCLAEYIAKKSGVRSLLYNTTKEVKHFTIWNFQLKKNNAPRS